MNMYYAGTKEEVDQIKKDMAVTDEFADKYFRDFHTEYAMGLLMSTHLEDILFFGDYALKVEVNEEEFEKVSYFEFDDHGDVGFEPWFLDVEEFSVPVGVKFKSIEEIDVKEWRENNEKLNSINLVGHNISVYLNGRSFDVAQRERIQDLLTAEEKNEDYVIMRSSWYRNIPYYLKKKSDIHDFYLEHCTHNLYDLEFDNIRPKYMIVKDGDVHGIIVFKDITMRTYSDIRNDNQKKTLQYKGMMDIIEKYS